MKAIEQYFPMVAAYLRDRGWNIHVCIDVPLTVNITIQLATLTPLGLKNVFAISSAKPNVGASPTAAGSWNKQIIVRVIMQMASRDVWDY